MKIIIELPTNIIAALGKDAQSENITTPQLIAKLCEWYAQELQRANIDTGDETSRST